MADTKTANISRMVIKQAGRAKEKVGTTAPAIAASVVISEIRLRRDVRQSSSSAPVVV